MEEQNQGTQTNSVDELVDKIQTSEKFINSKINKSNMFSGITLGGFVVGALTFIFGLYFVAPVAFAAAVVTLYCSISNRKEAEAELTNLENLKHELAKKVAPDEELPHTTEISTETPNVSKAKVIVDEDQSENTNKVEKQ